MGDVIESFASGIAGFIGNLFRSPLDFITGKSCSSVCTSPWDFFCHIEHFCVVNLLKMAAVLILLYIVLLFFYLLYKLRICKFIGKSLCHVVWSCFSCCFSLCRCRLCRKLLRNRHESLYCRSSLYNDGSISRRRISQSQPCRRSVHLRKSLRPRSHRTVVIRMDRQLGHGRRRRRRQGGLSVRGIRVLRESKFSRKGSRFRAVDKTRNRKK